MIVLSLTEFAAKRRGDQDDMEKEIFPEVHQAIEAYPVEGWYNKLLAEVARLYLSVFHNEGGKGQPKPSVAEFTAEVRATLDKTKDPTDATVDRLSVWLSTAILNAGTQAAAATDEEFLLMEWVTMHDSDVREAHREVEGQQRPPGDEFDVAGVGMRYPGDPTAPIELWINCRCTLAPVLASEANFRRTEGVTMTTTETEVETVPVAPLAWHGVLAPEGVWSGDGRMFAPDALRFRDLPLPLTWQKATSDGHDGSVVVGRIDTIERVDGMMAASGVFLATPEADEVVGLIAEFGKFGVSVDADDPEFSFDEDTGKITFTSARIASASVVSIPAFAEAYITLGPAQVTEEEECDPESPDYEDCLAKKGSGDSDKAPPFEPKKAAGLIQPHAIWERLSYNYPLPVDPTISATTNTTSTITFISEEKWDGSAGRFTPEQWKRACVLHVCDGMEKSCHKLPIKEPGGALSRAGVHAAAARFNQVDAPAEAKASAKSQLRGAYKQLGEEPPDVLKASAAVDTFIPEGKRGPGWITNPEDTQRIHNYWTKKGEEGYQKIGWGVPGDFNRCRVLVGEKIAENSPEDLIYLNRICAQWHHDALGYYPSQHHSAKDTMPMDLPKVGGPSVALVASADTVKAPADWFTDPHLPGPTHLTITAQGRVFGHIAEWKTCHIGYEGVCVAPPTSPSNYAYYATGRVLTDDGASVRTGVLSLGGGHAGPGLRTKAAMAHYDSTSSAVADVAVGEDEHGIWCAGWVRPGTTDEQVVALRASDVSGDWREIAGELEMVAALAVNTGGFPVVSVHDGTQVTLVAAGCIQSIDDPVEDLAAQIEKRLAARSARREKMKELALRVGGGE
jgi:hypothetical protein